MISVTSLFVSSCCQPTVQTVTEYKMVKPPASLLEPCPDVPLEVSTNGELVMSLVELRTQYFLCSLKMESIISFFSEETDSK